MPTVVVFKFLGNWKSSYQEAMRSYSLSDYILSITSLYCEGRHGREHMVVVFTTTYAFSPITTNVVSSNPTHGEVYPIKQYAIKFVSDLW